MHTSTDLVLNGGDGAAEEALHECGWKNEVPSSTSNMQLPFASRHTTSPCERQSNGISDRVSGTAIPTVRVPALTTERE